VTRRAAPVLADVFMTVQLLTRAGQAVARVQVPRFKVMPEAVAWGERVFIRAADGHYREGVLWPVVEPGPADGCELCLGARGHVRGNETRIEVTACDGCHAKLLRVRELR
jgi:hypothetical protein